MLKLMRLTIERQKEIDQVIGDVIKRTGLIYPNDSLIDIATKLGIEVYVFELPKEGERRVEGVIQFQPANSSKPRIVINSEIGKERRNFTLAHELGHFMLHNDGKTKLRVDFFDYNTDTKEAGEETEANYFAGSLLMPKDKFIEVLKQAETLHEVAEFFGVSESAVSVRLRWLLGNQK